MTRYRIDTTIWAEAESADAALEFVDSLLQPADGSYGGPYVDTWDYSPPEEEGVVGDSVQ